MLIWYHELIQLFRLCMSIWKVRIVYLDLLVLAYVGIRYSRNFFRPLLSSSKRCYLK